MTLSVTNTDLDGNNDHNVIERILWLQTITRLSQANLYELLQTCVIRFNLE